MIKWGIWFTIILVNRNFVLTNDTPFCVCVSVQNVNNVPDISSKVHEYYKVNPSNLVLVIYFLIPEKNVH